MLFTMSAAASVESQANGFPLRHYTFPCVSFSHFGKTHLHIQEQCIQQLFPPHVIDTAMEPGMCWGLARATEEYLERGQVAPAACRWLTRAQGWARLLSGLGFRSVSFSKCLQVCGDSER